MEKLSKEDLAIISREKGFDLNNTSNRIRFYPNQERPKEAKSTTPGIPNINPTSKIIAKKLSITATKENFHQRSRQDYFN